MFAFREVLAQQSVGVLVTAALPRASRVAEVNLDVGGDGEGFVIGHLLAAVPGERATQYGGQSTHVLGECGNDGGRVLLLDLDEDDEAGMAFNECSDVGVVASREQVAFPVTRH